MIKLLPTELIMCVFGVRFLCVHSCIKAVYKRATSCKWDAIKPNPKPFVGSFYTGNKCAIDGIVRPFKFVGMTRLIRSGIIKWRPRNFFL